MMTERQPPQLFIGIDPGKSGAIAVIDRFSTPIGFCKNDETPADVWTYLSTWVDDFSVKLVTIERVNAMPKQGVASTFKFGQSFGFLQGLVVAARYRCELVTPLTWQTAMQCRSKGNKNVTKRRAQELFPTMRMAHANADAFLLAEYGRRCWASRAGEGEA